MYRGERSFAWLFGVAAIALGVIGALVAYNVFDLRSLQDGTLNNGIGTRAQDFQDGLLLILPAIALGFLALTMHATNSMLAPGETVATKRWQAEHGASYVMALGTVFLSVAGIVVGYDVWDNGWLWSDGAVLQLLAIGAGVLTAALHAVGHYSRAPIEDDIRVIVESRVSQTLQRAGTALSTEHTEHR
jgi:hypothetical protein